MYCERAINLVMVLTIPRANDSGQNGPIQCTFQEESREIYLCEKHSRSCPVGALRLGSSTTGGTTASRGHEGAPGAGVRGSIGPESYGKARLALSAFLEPKSRMTMFARIVSQCPCPATVLEHGKMDGGQGVCTSKKGVI